jgi:hypothetical protein
MGVSLSCKGDITEGRAHLDRAIELYDPAEHRQLAMRFGQDATVTTLCYRSRALWLLGYSKAALADAERALKKAREIGQATSLMYALAVTSVVLILCRNHVAVSCQCDELIPLVDKQQTQLKRLAPD